jgi:hypothetical protein
MGTNGPGASDLRLRPSALFRAPFIIDQVLTKASTFGSGTTIILSDEHTGNPAFAADGYHLNAGSAAINRGIKAGVTTDIDGQPRDAAPNLGADEYPLTEKVYLPIVWRNQ